MRGTKLYGIVAAAFMVGAFIASPELRAYAANTVFSSDIVDGEVKSADIATNAVKSPEIATDAVGASEIAADSVTASELAGVTKLTFVDCLVTGGSNDVPAHGIISRFCDVRGVNLGDDVVATKKSGADCFAVSKASPGLGEVLISLRNECTTAQSPGSIRISIIVFDWT